MTEKPKLKVRIGETSSGASSVGMLRISIAASGSSREAGVPARPSVISLTPILKNQMAARARSSRGIEIKSKR